MTALATSTAKWPQTAAIASGAAKSSSARMTASANLLFMSRTL